MNTLTFAPVVNLLRDELAGYGALLALFERQQEQLWRREIEAVAESSRDIEVCAADCAKLRLERELWVREFALEHGRTAGSSLRQLLDLFPADQGPLLEALILEINQLIHRVRRGARHNQLILRRALEVHQETLALMQAPTRPRTYSGRGEVATPLMDASTLRAAV
jgi:flagellar biosynthesis/type III secretory pathway chaperone